jgi:hypothetical protein
MFGLPDVEAGKVEVKYPCSATPGQKPAAGKKAKTL